MFNKIGMNIQRQGTLTVILEAVYHSTTSSQWDVCSLLKLKFLFSFCMYFFSLKNLLFSASTTSFFSNFWEDLKQLFSIILNLKLNRHMLVLKLTLFALRDVLYLNTWAVLGLDLKWIKKIISEICPQNYIIPQTHTKSMPAEM